MPGIDVQQELVSPTTGGVGIAGRYFRYRIRIARGFVMLLLVGHRAEPCRPLLPPPPFPSEQDVR